MYIRCFNYFTALGPADEMKRFVDANVGYPAQFFRRGEKAPQQGTVKIFTMNAFMPVPADVVAAGEHPNTGRRKAKLYGMEWKRQNWGTEWDADNEYITPEDMGWYDEFPSCQVRFAFQGKDTPPDKWFSAVTAAFPALTLYMNYSIPDASRKGWYLSMNGSVSHREFHLDDSDMRIPPDDNGTEKPEIRDDGKPHDIPNDLAAKFNTVDGRRTLIALYGDRNTAFGGVNEDGEEIVVAFDTASGIVLRTYQSNGWVRVNYYDKDGYAAGETFDGKHHNEKKEVVL